MKVLKTVSLLDMCAGLSWALVLCYSVSKSCYYQANGPTQGGHVAFI